MSLTQHTVTNTNLDGTADKGLIPSIRTGSFGSRRVFKSILFHHTSATPVGVRVVAVDPTVAANATDLVNETVAANLAVRDLEIPSKDGYSFILQVITTSLSSGVGYLTVDDDMENDASP